MNHKAFCSNLIKHPSVDYSLGCRVYALLIVCMLLPALQVFGQGAPIGLMELKSMMETYNLGELNAEIEKRRVSFVLTDGVKAQLKKAVTNDDLKKNDYDGFGRLLKLIKEKEPEELVVAIAGFQGGSESDIRELRSAIERRLKESSAPPNLLRIEPISVGVIPINGDQAYQAGNESGVHLIVWGDWQTKATGETIFHPRIRVIQDSRKTPIERGTSEERYYKLDLAQSNGLDIVESGAVKTSNLIAALIAFSYYKKAEYENAAQIFKTISESDAEVYFYLGNCSLYSGRNEEAERDFKKAVDLDRNSLEARNNLGMVQYLTGRSKEAIESFRKALGINSNSDKTLDNLGIALVETGEIEEGIRNIKKAADINPSNAIAWHNYGAVLYNANQNIPAALDAFEHYLRLRPDDHETWFLCAGLIRRVSDSDGEKAREFLLKAIEGNPQKGEYLEEFVKYVPLMNDQKDLELYRKFYDRLPNIHFSKGSYRSIENLQRSIVARVSWLSVKLGEYREARKAVAGLKLSQEELSNCDKKLIYKLVSVEMAAEKFKEPLRKTYYSTIFSHFFRWYYREYPDPDMNPKPLLSAYEGLLRSQPSNLECLIGKGILQVEILGLREDAWISYGFVKPRLKKGQDPPDWAVGFAKDAERTLQRASGLTKDAALRRDLKICISKTKNLFARDK
jgi:Flp pilus assembly protein TadD